MSKNALVIIICSIAVCIYFSSCATGPPSFVIAGTVTDTESGQPIAGAKIFDDGYAGDPDWEKIESGFYEPNLPQWGDVTNANGNYAFLTWPEHHGIKIEATGYKSKRVSLYNGHFLGNKKDDEPFNVALERE